MAAKLELGRRMAARAKFGVSLLLVAIAMALARREPKETQPAREAKVAVHALAPQGSAGEHGLERLGSSALEQQLDQLEVELGTRGPAFPSPVPALSPLLGGRPGDGAGHRPDPTGTPSATAEGSLPGS
jgi:hypothetical protein